LSLITRLPPPELLDEDELELLDELLDDELELLDELLLEVELELLLEVLVDELDVELELLLEELELLDEPGPPQAVSRKKAESVRALPSPVVILCDNASICDPCCNGRHLAKLLQRVLCRNWLVIVHADITRRR
jgi:hypothetical protein